MQHLLFVKVVAIPMLTIKVSASSRLKMGHVGSITNYKKKGAVWPLFIYPLVNEKRLRRLLDDTAGHQGT